MDKISDFFEEFGLAIKIESNIRSEFSDLKWFIRENNLNKNIEKDRKRIIGKFIYGCEISIKEWGKILFHSNDFKEGNIKKYSKVLESIYIRRILKENKLSPYISVTKYTDNNLREVFRNKDFLKSLSTDLLIKSSFLTEEQMETSISEKLYSILNDSLENSGFNKKFTENFADILFDVLEKSDQKGEKNE